MRGVKSSTMSYRLTGRRPRVWDDAVGRRLRVELAEGYLHARHATASMACRRARRQRRRDPRFRHPLCEEAIIDIWRFDTHFYTQFYRTLLIAAQLRHRWALPVLGLITFPLGFPRVIVRGFPYFILPFEQRPVIRAEWRGR